MRKCIVTTYSSEEIEIQRGESHVPRVSQPADGNSGTNAPDSYICALMNPEYSQWPFHVSVGDMKNDTFLYFFFLDVEDKVLQFIQP